MEDRLDLVRVTRAVWTRRRFVVVNTLALAVLAAGVSFVIPSRYRSVTSLLPPDEDGGAGLIGISAMLQKARIPGFRLAGSNTTSDLMSAILESRTVRDPIVEEFGLEKQYKTRTRDEALRTLNDRATSRVTDEGIVVLTVFDREAKRAADIANRHVELLDRFNREVRTTTGGRTRAFIEQRIGETRRDLASAEEALRLYQESQSAPLLPGSEAAAMDAAASVMARKIALEVDLSMLREVLTPGASELRQKELELLSVEREIGKLPAVGMELARLYREVRVQEEVYALLVAQYEEAKIQETRDTPTIQVLDRAVPAQKRSWPKRKLIVLVTSAAAFLLAAAAAVALEDRRAEAR
jgi:uncharacterized protein involved in exopolysaccharide biosynthesis